MRGSAGVSAIRRRAEERGMPLADAAEDSDRGEDKRIAMAGGRDTDLTRHRQK